MNDFAFLAPARLVLMALPLFLAVGYAVAAHRRRRWALRFTTVELLDEVAPDRPGWRRALPAAAMLAGLVVGVLAVAKPAVATTRDETRRIVVLAVDSSLSMEATDVAPSRMKAAISAAGDFLDTVPEGVAVGLVGFDGRARELMAPTTRLEAVRSSLDRLDLGEGTAIGEAVFLALDAIDAETDRLAETGDDGPAGTVVLLSDGETTEGRPNDEAAAAARDQGVAVHTIAFGTDGGVIIDPLGAEVPVPVNEDALRRLAASTDGRALAAATGEELSRVYEDLGRSVKVETERTEVTDWFAGAAAGLAFLGALGSLVWFGRLP
jgi:Ca-activated chloride channel family protein